VLTGDDSADRFTADKTAKSADKFAKSADRVLTALYINNYENENKYIYSNTEQAQKKRQVVSTVSSGIGNRAKDLVFRPVL